MSTYNTYELDDVVQSVQDAIIYLHSTRENTTSDIAKTILEAVSYGMARGFDDIQVMVKLPTDSQSENFPA